MEELKTWLLTVDTMVPIMLIVGGFIAYELYSGEVPVRWLGSIRRDKRPIFYWLSILFHLAIMGVIVYAWMDGLKMPVSIFFE